MQTQGTTDTGFTECWNNLAGQAESLADWKID